uniref:Uncharacterized protein n=2 Tax=Picea TaxID=3328 RepID=A0A101LWU0_PICGL|nr:hypothetical protein ABT39_MTgene6249 [Picea glauca]QHR92630.1 hypothetical protein Q903MT_gene6677 [Picea sitchensis]
MGRFDDYFPRSQDPGICSYTCFSPCCCFFASFVLIAFARLPDDLTDMGYHCFATLSRFTIPHH